MVFTITEDYSRAESIFDFFNNRINSELNNGVGGFSQFRDRNGIPNNHRWLGDNAWLLIALNNYKSFTGSSRYNLLSEQIKNWILSLQDSDGGFFSGYGSDGAFLNYKVTEGNIDVYNAVLGYDSSYNKLLQFLGADRWNSNNGNLMAWPENPKYRYALDNHSWAYLIFKDYPINTLSSANRFKCIQTASINGNTINGYDTDEDRDAVFIEGTGQMALAFTLSGQKELSDFYLKELFKLKISSTMHTNASGLPYSSNLGTAYGDAPLWFGADTKIAISSNAWYLFTKYQFNPFAVGIKTSVPKKDQFWLN